MPCHCHCFVMFLFYLERRYPEKTGISFFCSFPRNHYINVSCCYYILSFFVQKICIEGKGTKSECFHIQCIDSMHIITIMIIMLVVVDIYNRLYTRETCTFSLIWPLNCCKYIGFLSFIDCEWLSVVIFSLVMMTIIRIAAATL